MLYNNKRGHGIGKRGKAFFYYSGIVRDDGKIIKVFSLSDKDPKKMCPICGDENFIPWTPGFKCIKCGGWWEYNDKK